MADTPPARPFVLTADAIKGLRWSIDHSRARGEQVMPVDLVTLEYLLDLADAQMIPKVEARHADL